MAELTNEELQIAIDKARQAIIDAGKAGYSEGTAFGVLSSMKWHLQRLVAAQCKRAGVLYGSSMDEKDEKDLLKGVSP